MSDLPLLLVGSGRMALDYAKVLQALGIPFDVIGRRPETCAAFAAKTGVEPLSGGLIAAFARLVTCPQSAIVTVDVEQLASVTEYLLIRGVRRILVEKPAGLNAAEIAATARLAKQKGAEVFVAYNRRFYASTQKARELIVADGGVTSFFFEFTEWSHQIATLPTPKPVKRQWFLCNSSHVCDLAFFLCGGPSELSTHSKGALDWHPAGAQFVGCGVSVTGAPFSYHSNWESAGRWGVEICTRKRRLYLRPLEALSEQMRGDLVLAPVPLDDRLDKEFKPGIYEQTRAFLGGNDAGLLPIEDHARCAAEVYAHMVPTDQAAPIFKTNASAAASERRRVLIVGDSTAAPRPKVKYRDTWEYHLKETLPNQDVIALVSRGRTTDFLGLNPTRRPDGTVDYDHYSLESFEPSIVILNLGVVDCAPRLFSLRESFFVDRIPKRFRDALIFAAKRIRTRTDLRAYVGPGKFEGNVRQYFERCRNAGIDRVVVIGIATPDERALASNPGMGEAATRYNDIYKRLCKDFEFATFIDPLHPRESVSPLYLEDGYHLSPHGHSVVYDAIAVALGLRAHPASLEMPSVESTQAPLHAV